MRPIDFKESNRQFGKPDTMTDEKCMPLSAYVSEDKGDGEGGYVNTVWMPSKEDLIAINAGRPIVVSHSFKGEVFMQPHSLFTFDENGNSNEG